MADELQTRECHCSIARAIEGQGGSQGVYRVKSVKRVVMAAVIALACAGIYGALRNLPVASGCAFYGKCPQTVEAERIPGTRLTGATFGAQSGVQAP